MDDNPRAALAGSIGGEIATVISGGIGKIGGEAIETTIQKGTANLIRNTANKAKAKLGAIPGITTSMDEIVSKMDDVIASSTSVVPTLIERVKATAMSYEKDKATGSSIDASIAGAARPTDTQQMRSGGVVYASNGTLVNFQPRGTDTVPAMLTPGEFVINR